MKIAHVLRRLSFDDWGGTEQVVWNIAKAQKAAGHEVRVFATTALWKGLLAAKNAESAKAYLCPLRSLRLKNEPCAETVEGIEILRFKPIYPWWPMPKGLIDELDRKGGNPFVPGLGKALREWKPDVIHCHAMARIAELCLRVADQESGVSSRNRPLRVGATLGEATEPSGASAEGSGGSAQESGGRIKCVVSLHGGGANVPVAEAKSLKAPTRGRLPWGKVVDIAMGWTRRVPEDFDGIICVGEDEYERYRAKHPHVMFLPNGVDTAMFESVGVRECGSEGVRECGSVGVRVDTLNAPTHPLTTHPLTTLLCVARIDRQKNQMMIVEALAKHPEMTARFVGPVTQQDYRAELERRAVELGVADRVAFVGALRPGSPELLGEYTKADVFVLPSRHEPFGIVVLEAWAAGLPVIASDIGGLGKLCAAHPEAALTFKPGDAAGLGLALDEMSRKIAHGEAKKMSEEGQKAARQYDWSNLSARLVGFYGEL